jgi:Skp family chaperone for outer membrane proteins
MRDRPRGDELVKEERGTVKRTILLVAGLAALAAAAYFGNQLRAQQGPAAGAAPTASGGTRIAIVNIGTVFAKYEKAKAIKDEMQTTLKPYKDKADKWRAEMIQYQEFITKKQFDKYKEEDLQKAILERKRAMEDLDRELRPVIGKKQEEQLVQLWKEVNQHITRYGSSQGFHIVMGYGDPVDPKELDTFPNINRKMQGMDLGGVCPLYVANGLDITNDVVLSLNATYRQAAGGAAGTTPTSAAPKSQ